MNPRVLVIGGGPGGLALAQGLRRAGITVRVVERERWRTDGVYGFRLRLRRRGIDALRRLLPPELFGAFERTCGSAPPRSLLLDEQLRPLPMPEPGADDDVVAETSVSRITLQQILLAGLGDVVDSGRAFTHYETLADGRVRAFFDDGSSDVADVLVGADGADSRVRRQLLPQARQVDSGAQRIAGKIDLTPASAARLPSWLLHTTVSVRSSAGWHLFVTAHRRRHRGLQPADAAFTGNDAALDHRAGLLFDNTRDYLYWALGVPRALRPDAAALARGPQALLEWVRRQAAAFTWAPDLQALLAVTDGSTVNATPVVAALRVPPWPTGAVTLLGDAIHGMTYFRALGANAALVDASLLQQALLDVQQGRVPLHQALAGYEQAMLRHGFDAVNESVASLRRNLGGVGPAEDWPEVRREPAPPPPLSVPLAARVEDEADAAPLRRQLFFHDPVSLPLLAQIERVARSPATVLLLGETGTGKDLVARHLHQRSGRGGPFVALNCAALAAAPDTSTAPPGARGWLDAAQGGTLFLDEVGDTPPAMQARLLRLLQEQQLLVDGGLVNGVGVGVGVGTAPGRGPDVRIIAATHVDLATAVQAGHFRADLYYRLHVAALRLPPLRERRGDILPLARHFAETFRRRLDVPPLRFSAEAEAALRAHAWPGNIRELENAVHYAVIAGSGGLIEPAHLRLGLASADAGAAPASGPANGPARRLAQLVQELLAQDTPALFEQIERGVLATAYEASGANQLRTAQRLGLSRHVLRARLLHFGLIADRGLQRARPRQSDVSTSGRKPPD